MTGLEENCTYEIISAYDGSVLDLPDGTLTNGAAVISCVVSHGRDNHKWIAQASEKGGDAVFLLTSPCQEGHFCKVLDQYVEQGKLVHYMQHGNPNQQWAVKKIMGNKYKIVSLHNGKVLENPVETNEIAVVDERDDDDERQIWILVCV